MIYLSPEWRARKTARWLRYVRRHNIPHDREINRRCWCSNCYQGRNPFRVRYLKQLKRAKNVRNSH